MSENTPSPSSNRELSRAVARIKAGIMGVILGLLCGVGMFVATAWLLIQGGVRVGEHLNLLGHFFIGYDVSWPGAFIGFFYGALVGGVVGFATGLIYNQIVGLRGQ